MTGQKARQRKEANGMSFTHIMIKQEIAKSRKYKQGNPEQFIEGMIWRQITEQDMKQAWNNIPQSAQTEEVKKVIFANVGTWEPAIVPEHGHICCVKDIEKVINEVKKYLGDGDYEWRPL